MLTRVYNGAFDIGAWPCCDKKPTCIYSSEWRVRVVEMHPEQQLATAKSAVCGRGIGDTNEGGDYKEFGGLHGG
jgi:hypothetical protein